MHFWIPGSRRSRNVGNFDSISSSLADPHEAPGIALAMHFQRSIFLADLTRNVGTSLGILRGAKNLLRWAMLDQLPHIKEDYVIRNAPRLT